MGKMTCEVVEGVRRAKAALRCGRETIAAQIDGEDDVLEVPIASLLSPKLIIEDNGPRKGIWGVVYRMTQRGDFLRRIIIKIGGVGTPIVAVAVAEDELELFRQRFLGHKNTDPQLLARILDHADALGFMLMDSFCAKDGEETPSLFRRHLQGIEDAFDGFQGLTRDFDRNMKRGSATPQQGRALATANA